MPTKKGPVDQPPPRPPGFEGRCAAKKGPNHECSELCKERKHLCFNKSHFPGTNIGNGRCKHHGALNTGAKTREGKMAQRTNGITHGAHAKFTTWEQYRRSKYSLQEQDLIDQIPTTPDLTPEIQAARMKMEHLERNRIVAMNKAERHEAARLLDPEAKAEDYGLEYNRLTGQYTHNGVAIERWVEAENHVRDTLRKLLHTQKEINPAGRAKGNLQLNISVTAQAQAKSEEEVVPELHEDVEAATPSSGGSAAEEEDKAEPRKDDDIQD